LRMRFCTWWHWWKSSIWPIAIRRAAVCWSQSRNHYHHLRFREYTKNESRTAECLRFTRAKKLRTVTYFSFSSTATAS
jgi:hypothetical protein